MATWSTAEARGNLSRLLHAADEEPQVITNRGRPVAVVIDIDEYAEYRRWREGRPADTLSAVLDELTEACASEEYALPVPERRDRPSPLAVHDRDR